MKNVLIQYFSRIFRASERGREKSALFISRFFGFLNFGVILNALMTLVFTALIFASAGCSVTVRKSGVTTLPAPQGVTPAGLRVTNVTSSTANGSYNAGNTIAVDVTFSEIVYVTGTPKITFDLVARQQNFSYVSGSGTNTLTFNVAIIAGDGPVADLDYNGAGALNLFGGTIKNAAGAVADLTLPTPGAAGSLSYNKDIVIDTVAPQVSNVTSSTANGSYAVGATISIQVTFDSVVNVTGTPKLALAVPGSYQISYVSGSGSTTLNFAYAPLSGHNSADLDYFSNAALTLNGGTIKDIAGNDAVLTLANPGAAGSLGNNKAIVIDTTAPAVSYVTSSNANGNYVTNDSVTIQVVFDSTVYVTGTPQIAINPGASYSLNYASGSGSTTLNFAYTVQAAHSSTDLDYAATTSLTLNGGTIKDLAGNAATLTLDTVGAANSLGGRKNLTINQSSGINLEVPIDIISGYYVYSSNTGTSGTGPTKFTFDTTNYDGTLSYIVEITASNNDGNPRSIYVKDTGGNTKGTINLPASSALSRYSTVFTPNAGSDTYHFVVDQTTNNNDIAVYGSKLKIKQVGATKTRVFIPLYSGQGEMDGTGNYRQVTARDFYLWNKDSTKYSTLSGSAFTFDTLVNLAGVIGDDMGCKVSLFNNTTTNQIVASEVNPAGGCGQAQCNNYIQSSVSFANNAVEFTDGNKLEVKSKMTGADDGCTLIRAGVYITVTSLSHAEVFYRVGNNGNIVVTAYTGMSRTLIDQSFFSSYTSYFEATLDGLQSAELGTYGTNDIGNGTGTIAGSTLSPAGVRNNYRSGSLTLTNNDRYGIHITAAAGGILLGGGFIVIGF